jgi:hypothetical protein
MPFSTERVLLAWVEDLEQGLEELARSSRRPHRDDLLKDLLESARELLALSQSELRKLSTASIPLLESDPRNIRSSDDIGQLCNQLRQIFPADGVNRESTD